MADGVGGRKRDWTGPPHLSSASAIPDYIIPAYTRQLDCAARGVCVSQSVL